MQSRRHCYLSMCHSDPQLKRKYIHKKPVFGLSLCELSAGDEGGNKRHITNQLRLTLIDKVLLNPLPS